MGGKRSAGEITGAVLAGGKARRFRGLSKALLDVGGQRIIDLQLTALRAVTVAQIVVANDPSPFADLGVPVVADLVSGAGPLGGLYTALQTAPALRVLVLACDLPCVDEAFLRFLTEYAPDADAVVPRAARGLQPLCAVYATRILPVVERRISHQQLALHRLLDDISTTIVEATVVAPFDPDGLLFANINTPAEYEAIRASRLGPHAPLADTR